MMPEEQSGSKKGLIIGIVVGVIVVAIAGVVVFLQIRKKKKAAALIASELNDLEAELENEDSMRP